MKIAFKTFGCKANTTDTDALYLEAKKRGFDVVEETQAADAYVINSCTVTSGADKDARVQANRFKRQNPLAFVAVVGCYAQVAKDELLEMPEVDFVVGTANKFRILDLFTEALDRADWERDQVEPAKGFLPEHFPGSRHSRAAIKIQDGCNFSCSFCIIPQARGRSRSLGIEAILKQVQTAHEEGFEEIVLTGIHIAHYGWDVGTDLMALLRKILETPAGPRLRVSTLDPFEIPDELIALMDYDRFCPHFHIALQSGSDRVLKDMRRIYSAQEFIDSTKKIQAKRPDAFIGVDVIVGFPGEDDEAFEETVKCLEASPWTKLHVFPFSIRKGTRAEQLPGRVSPRIIAARSEKLRMMSEERYQAFLLSQMGTRRRVILERPSRAASDTWHGHTENYVPIKVHLPMGTPRLSVPVILNAVSGEKALATTV